MARLAPRHENGERVTWRFRSVVEVQEVAEDTLVDGVEVLSRLYRKRKTRGCQSLRAIDTLLDLGDSGDSRGNPERVS
jgi:hypothetical protein